MRFANVVSASLLLSACVHGERTPESQISRSENATYVASLIKGESRLGQWRLLGIGLNESISQIEPPKDWTCEHQGSAVICNSSRRFVVTIDTFNGRISSFWLGVPAASSRRVEMCKDFHEILKQLSEKFGRPGAVGGIACSVEEPDGMASAAAAWVGHDKQALILEMSNSPDAVHSYFLGLTLEHVEENLRQTP